MKRNTWKRIMALGMAAIMATGMLACGGSDGKDSASTSDKAETSGDEGILTEAGTYPIVKEGKELELTIFTMSMPNVEDFETNDFTLYLEELTGIDLTFVTGSRDDWSEKLNMLLNSGDYPDVILGVTPDIAKYGVSEQILVPLDDYMNADVVPNYMALMEENGYDINVCRETDGKIYSMVNVNDCFHCKFARKMWVNTAILDQLGMEIPETTDEFKAVCEAFLEKNPNGIAVAGATSGWFTRVQDWLLGAYTFIPSSSYTLGVKDYVVLDTETDKVMNVATTDAYKEGLKFMHELYEMGAIYDGTFTQASEQLKQVVNQEDVLFFPAGTISDIIDSASNNELYRKYECMAPIAGPDGTRIAWTIGNYGVSSGAVTITEDCENVEAALRLMDFFYGPTGDLMSQYGSEEGTDWVLNPEGKFGLNGEPATYEVLNTYSGEAQNHDWQDVGIRVATESYRLGQAVETGVDPYAPEGLELLLFNASKDLYEPYSALETSKLQQNDELKITSEESDSVSTIVVEINKIIHEDQTAFITGTKDIDKEWDAYVESLNAAGMEELLAFYQTAYDRTK